MATNTGTRPGVITDAGITTKFVGLDEHPVLGSLTDILPATPADAFIQPGAQQIVFRIQPNINYQGAVFGMAAATSASLSNAPPATWVQFNVKEARGRETTQSFALSNSVVTEVLSMHASRCKDLTNKDEKVASGCWGLSDEMEESDRAHDELQEALARAANR